MLGGFEMPARHSLRAYAPKNMSQPLQSTQRPIIPYPLMLNHSLDSKKHIKSPALD